MVTYIKSQERGIPETCILSFDLSLFDHTCFLKFDISHFLLIPMHACYNQSLIHCRNPVRFLRNLMMSTVAGIGREQIKVYMEGNLMYIKIMKLFSSNVCVRLLSSYMMAFKLKPSPVFHRMST